VIGQFDRDIEYFPRCVKSYNNTTTYNYTLSSFHTVVSVIVIVAVKIDTRINHTRIREEYLTMISQFLWLQPLKIMLTQL